MRLTWTLAGAGWADGVVEGELGRAEFSVSCIAPGPERAQFEAEPTAFRWVFYREGEMVWVRVLELPDGGAHDGRGVEIWSGVVGVEELGRAAIRCFDEVERVYGVSGYRGKWGEHFPSVELEALRRLVDGLP
ncbi:hypothetical protein IAG44_22520 [Streptomyces roseirectus]|uniref:Uncharacterized protein n=1 Tax=Streptomyces roseirectus TaxID=2768066 RepID=A0A7H0IGJ6_9ACTN|nr:hypothetical protein [Streptomyces roseirectus]QNP71912.1 hypothetical protein IAG44_22520 [Streptomyces roseirectus]